MHFFTGEHDFPQKMAVADKAGHIARLDQALLLKPVSQLLGHQNQLRISWGGNHKFDQLLDSGGIIKVKADQPVVQLGALIEKMDRDGRGVGEIIAGALWQAFEKLHLAVDIFCDGFEHQCGVRRSRRLGIAADVVQRSGDKSLNDLAVADKLRIVGIIAPQSVDMPFRIACEMGAQIGKEMR